ncbi:MAG: tetratricopeptide repeat protein [Microthrixaceae bacterium]
MSDNGQPPEQPETPPDDSASDSPDADEAAAAAGERDAYKRRVAVTLALLGVMGAWIGVLHTDSGSNEALYARQTTRAAVESMRANVNAQTVAGLEIDLDAEQAGLGVAGSTEDGTGGATTNATAGDAEQAEEAAAGLDGQERDELRRELTRTASRLKLRRSALAETRVTYNNRTSQYETVLTTLAVALFLVGFTLVLNRKTRPPVLIPGLLLAAYVGGWALWIHQREIPTTRPEAIDAAAEGETHLEFGEYELAAQRFGEAIELDDDFLAAYTGRSIASFFTANPDAPSTLAVIDADGPEAQQAMADAERAVELGGKQDFLSLYISGLYRFFGDDFPGAVERLNLAAEANDAPPETSLALGAAYLADGDDEAASEALKDGVDKLDPAAESAEARQLAADLFTMLEYVAATVPERAEAVADVRTRLAAGEANLSFGEPEAGTPDQDGAPEAAFRLERSSFRDGRLEVGVGYEGLAPDSRVTLYAYLQLADGAPFAQPAELARFVELEGSGVLRGEATLELSCAPVAIRYDLYVDGVPSASFAAPGVDATC